MEQIPLFKVHIPKEIIPALEETLFSGTITEGPKAQLFEKTFQEYINNPNTALLNSCTNAITLALRLAGVKNEDEVITTPMTCLATNVPILTLGAKPIWADINPDTGNINPKTIESLITPKTKAIICAHWAGMPSEVDKINVIAKKYGIKVIEDAAQALGAEYNNLKIGNHSDYVCFSFQAIKQLTTADGGAIACKTQEDYKRAVLLRWFGLSRTFKKTPVFWDTDVIEPGYKMHMNDLNATMGLVQMKYIDGIIAKHIVNAQFLREKLKDMKGIELPKIPPNSKPCYWMFTIKLDNPESRKKFSEYLTEHGIGNSIAHERNDKYSIFKDFQKSLPGVDDFSDRMLNIPCGWWLTPENLDYIAKTCREALKT